jgi:hypothetical protein
LRCLLSDALGLEPLPLWHDALREFIKDSAERQARADSRPV